MRFGVNDYYVKYVDTMLDCVYLHSKGENTMQMTSEELKAAEIRSQLTVIDLMIKQVQDSAKRIDAMLAELMEIRRPA
jgi:hypothetical protein